MSMLTLSTSAQHFATRPSQKALTAPLPLPKGTVSNPETGHVPYPRSRTGARRRNEVSSTEMRRTAFVLRRARPCATARCMPPSTASQLSRIRLPTALTLASLSRTITSALNWAVYLELPSAHDTWMVTTPCSRNWTR